MSAIEIGLGNQMQARRRRVYLTGSDDAPPFAAMEAYSVNFDGSLNVRKPSRDDIPCQHILFNGPTTLRPGQGYGTKILPTVAYYNDAIAVSNRENVGTKKNDWRLHRGYEGFVAIGGVQGQSTLITVLPFTRCRQRGAGGYYSQGGSGSIAAHCCGCERFACPDLDPNTTYPTSLTFTATAACMGSRAVTISRATFGTSFPYTGGKGCNDTASAGDINRVIYVGSYDSGATGLAFATLCDGTPFLYINTPTEYMTVEVACCSGNTIGSWCPGGIANPEPSDSWWKLKFYWQKIVGGNLYEADGYVDLTIVSCSPLSLTITKAPACEAALPIHPGPCSSFGENKLVTSGLEAAGCSFQLDAVE